MIDNVELLIFSSRELPLQHWSKSTCNSSLTDMHTAEDSNHFEFHWIFNWLMAGYKSKYFLWGVFRRKQRSRLSTETASPIQQNSSTEHFPLSEPIVEANDKRSVHPESADHLCSRSEPNRSPSSMNSSQASNMLPAKHSTPDSLSSPSIQLNSLDKKSQCEEQNFEGKESSI